MAPCRSPRPSRASSSSSAWGSIRDWGVSNFDLSDMQELSRVAGGSGVQTDQVLYNLSRRGIEWDLLPWCLEHGRPIMAYSPIEQGRLLHHPVLQAIAERLGATTGQVALAWVLRLGGVAAIPKAGTPQHVMENRGRWTCVSLRRTWQCSTRHLRRRAVLSRWQCSEGPARCLAHRRQAQRRPRLAR